MTLSTDLYVLDEIDAHEVFMFCQRMLAKYDDLGRLPDQQGWTDEQDGTWRAGERTVEPDNPWTVSTDCGQGLPAWTFVHYRKNGPLTTAEQAEQCTDNCDTGDEDEPYHHHPHACWLSIDWDTAYGARSNGMGCGDLHAAFIGEIGPWLDEKGIRWEWRNEFTGEVHGGEERYSALIGLLSGGFEATAWFRTTALPAIAAHIASEVGGVS